MRRRRGDPCDKRPSRPSSGRRGRSAGRCRRTGADYSVSAPFRPAPPDPRRSHPPSRETRGRLFDHIANVPHRFNRNAARQHNGSIKGGRPGKRSRPAILTGRVVVIGSRGTVEIDPRDTMARDASPRHRPGAAAVRGAGEPCHRDVPGREGEDRAGPVTRGKKKGRTPGGPSLHRGRVAERKT